MPERWDTGRWSGDLAATPAARLEQIYGLKLSGLYVGLKEPDGGVGAPVLVAQGTPNEDIDPDLDDFAYQAPLLNKLFSFLTSASFDAPNTAFFAAELEAFIGLLVFKTTGANSGLFSTRDSLAPNGGYEVQIGAGGGLLATIDDGPAQQALALATPINDNTWQTVTVAICRNPTVNEFIIIDDFVKPSQVQRATLTVGSIPAGAVFAVGGSRIPVAALTEVALMGIFQGPQIDETFDHRKLHALHRELRLSLTSEVVIAQVE